MDPVALAEALVKLIAAVQQQQAPATTAQKTPLSVQEAAERLCISKGHVYKLIRDGEIRGIRLGKRRLIPTAEAERIIDSAGGR